MSIADWDEKDIEHLDEGLKLVGWSSDDRLTSDDALMLRDVANEAIKMRDNRLLTPDVTDNLALKAFDILEFQIMNIDERALQLSSAYSDSQYLRPLVPLIDQSLFCYFRGYFTAALATLFILLEKYLRGLKGWKAGDKDPTFAELRAAIQNLPDSDSRDNAQRIINIIYARYDAANPPQFFFNRHGLLHGMREAFYMDRLNCVRMYLLLDHLVAAEGFGGGGFISDVFKLRRDTYQECKKSAIERSLLYPK